VTEHRWVEDEASFRAVLDELAGVDVYAVDTEFHRERTYYPQVALVQLAWADQIVLVDPLAVSLQPFAEILEGDGLAVMHAAAQDLEVLEQACGAIPKRLFDTQLAAGFAGHGTPSLTNLAEKSLGVRLPKGDRLTDWLSRPLNRDQRSYAADDVAYLVELYRLLVKQLEADQRLAWAEEECEMLRTRVFGQRDPADAWLRIKEARHLRGRAAAIARALAAWREQRAMDTDQPVRFVLADLGVVGIAQRAPRTVEQLRAVRGVDGRHLRGTQAAEILEVVAQAHDEPPPRARVSDTMELDRQLRPAVTLVSAWLSQLSREQRIETSLLGTRSDIEAFLAHDPDARLAHGWRHELVGEPVRRLVEGEAALAFDGRGGLVLEPRAGRTVK
jgi:ribonuclease D